MVSHRTPKRRSPKAEVLKKYPKARLSDARMLIENGHFGPELSDLCDSPKQAWANADRRINGK